MPSLLAVTGGMKDLPWGTQVLVFCTRDPSCRW
jgi:hypothetical protein